MESSKLRVSHQQAASSLQHMTPDAPNENSPASHASFNISVVGALNGELLATLPVTPEDTWNAVRIATEKQSGSTYLKLFLEDVMLEGSESISSSGIWEDTVVLAMNSAIEPESWRKGGLITVSFIAQTSRQDGKSLAIHENGDLLVTAGATASQSHVGVWSVQQNTNLHTLQGYDGVKLHSVAVEGDTVASGSADGSIQLWSLSTSECVARLSEHSQPVFSLALRGDVLVSGSRHEAKLWSVNKRTCNANLRCDGNAYTVSLSEDMVVCGGSGGIRVWRRAFLDATLDALEPELGPDPEPASYSFGRCAVYDICIADDKLAAATISKVQLWSLADGTLIRDVVDGTWAGVALLGNMLVIGSWGPEVQVWSLAGDGELIAELNQPGSSRTGVGILPAGRIVSFGTDGTVCVWCQAC